MRRIPYKSLPPPPEEPQAPGRTLTVGVYHGTIPLERRQEFDDWLREESLIDKYIVEATFGEHRVDCVCVDQPIRLGTDGEHAVMCKRSFNLRTEPPSWLRQYLQ